MASIGICGSRGKLKSVRLSNTCWFLGMLRLSGGYCVGRRRWGWYRLIMVCFYPWAMVVLVACTLSVAWSSWWALARLTSGPVVLGRL